MASTDTADCIRWHMQFDAAFCTDPENAVALAMLQSFLRCSEKTHVRLISKSHKIKQVKLHTLSFLCYSNQQEQQ